MRNVEAYTLFSGSSGNVTYIKSGRDEFLIDAGVSCRAIERALDSIGTSIKRIRAIFVTHEHSDHVKGLEIISKKHKIPVFISSQSASVLTAKCRYVENLVTINEPGDKVYLDETLLETGKTPHDSADCSCFKITLSDGTRLGYATDIGTLTEEVKDILSGCNYAVIESNHDIEMLKGGAYPAYLKRRILSDHGHLSNSNCAKYLPTLAANGTESIVLAHLSKENNHPSIAFRESRIALNTAGIRVKLSDVTGDIILNVASPSTPVKIIH